MLAACPAPVAAIGLGARCLLVPLALVAALAIPPGTTKPADDGRVLYETETPYQYARVIEEAGRHAQARAQRGPGDPLAVAAGHGADRRLLGRLPRAAVRDRVGRPPGRIAALGTAGGTVPRAYAQYFPETRIDAVDIDPELFEIGRRYFGLEPRPQLREFAEDARPFLRQTDERYDSIFVDAYRQPYIPFYLTTREFFELVRERLNPAAR